MKNKNWGCKLENITIQRGEAVDAFRLKIPYLHLSAKKIDSNKLPLMGRSGAGKSSLLNLISAMEWPVEGEVSWSFPNGDTIRWGKKGLPSAQAKKLRSSYFGYAFQASTLIPHLTVLDNLCYPLQVKGIDNEKTQKKDRDTFYNELLPEERKKLFKMLKKCPCQQKAAEKLYSVLLPEEKKRLYSMLNKFPDQLSGGQRQRVSLVQSMIHDPYVLFADEPTGSLDADTRKQVMDVVRKWVNESSEKHFLFWVTHHDTDPQESNVSLRLAIEEGRCLWQRYDNNKWVVENKDEYMA